MAESIPLDDFRALTQRAGLDLTDAELEELKPMYDHYLEPIALHERARPLTPKTWAVVYSPG